MVWTQLAFKLEKKSGQRFYAGLIEKQVCERAANFHHFNSCLKVSKFVPESIHAGQANIYLLESGFPLCQLSPFCFWGLLCLREGIFKRNKKQPWLSNLSTNRLAFRDLKPSFLIECWNRSPSHPCSWERTWAVLSPCDSWDDKQTNTWWCGWRWWVRTIIGWGALS